jgi:MFS family permease
LRRGVTGGMLRPFMASPASPSALRQLLAQPDYVRFWLNRFTDVVAVQIQSVAIGWQVYIVARESVGVAQAAFMVGMIGLAQFIAVLGCTLNAGEAADRLDRKKIMMAAMTIEVISAGVLAWLAWLGHPHLWPIFTVALFFGAARAFYSPASGAMGPMLVPREILPRAVAFNSLAWQGGSIVGPAIGGLLCAISPTVAFATSAALYVICILVLSGIRQNTKPVTQAGSRMALVREGLAYVWTNKIVLGATSLDLFAVLLGGATALLPVFAKDVLHVGAEGFGILRAAPAIGATTMAVILASRPIRQRAGLWMFGGVAVFGAATVVFGLSNSLWLSVAALAVLGGADMISVFVRSTVVQLAVPDAMRGRVMAVSGLFIGASNELGEFESGVVARFLGPVRAALFGGIGALAVTGLWAWMFPALRKADRLD